VAEPSAKSIDVARRAAQIIRERRIGMLLVAANRVRDAGDLAMIREHLTDLDVLAVPDDPLVTQADREGRSPVDLAPDAPAVRAVAELAQRLERQAAPGRMALPVLE
jgi:CO dehydrogenase maturation factor